MKKECFTCSNRTSVSPYTCNITKRTITLIDSACVDYSENEFMSEVRSLMSDWAKNKLKEMESK